MSLNDSRIFCVIALILGSTVSAYITRLDVPVPGPPDVLPVADFVPILIEVPGRVQNVYVKEATKVHAGDLLVQFDTRSLLLKKRALESQVHAAELLVTDGRPHLSGVYRELEQVRLDLGRLTVTSPIDGQIAYLVPLAPGDTLRAGTAIAVVSPQKAPSR
jgi:multidrug resistance efflux pump